MKQLAGKMKYVFGMAVFLAVALGGRPVSVHADTDFMVDWKAKTYVPAWYEGKAFPTYQSFITIGFELIENGKVVDLSKTAIRWYVDGKLLKNETSGLGIRQVTVYNKKYGGDMASIKIAIPDYKGQALTKLLDIPVKKPEVVIDVPYAGKKVARGESLLFAWPFFFNATGAEGLSLQWKVDGNALKTSSASNARLLFLAEGGAREGAKSTIEATVINPGKAIEHMVKKVLVDLP